MKNKAIFLDRDGVVNMERGDHTWKAEDFKFVDEIFECCSIIAAKGYLIIIITNQSGIAKGLYSHDDVKNINDYMINSFQQHSIDLTEIYYCPHFDEKGKCLCRKPGSLLIEKAIAKFNIDPSQSLMVGDKQRDIDAAQKAGVNGVLIDSNSSIMEIAKNLE